MHEIEPHLKSDSNANRLLSDTPLRILVTGDSEELLRSRPDRLADNGRAIEWISLPVLRYERLKVSPDVVERVVGKPFDWIVFTSPRASRFWAEVLMENGVDFPIETQVACIGDKTAEAADRDGFTADFYPTEPGTEAFLEEFEDMISNNSARPSVFIPMAEGGRPKLRDRLKELGCEVSSISMYRTLPREDLNQSLSAADLERTALILFTSPSSVDAFTGQFSVPSQVKVASLGQYTARHLEQKGFSDQRMLPQGDLHRIGELL